jgi:hypothetical protein
LLSNIQCSMLGFSIRSPQWLPTPTQLQAMQNQRRHSLSTSLFSKWRFRVAYFKVKQCPLTVTKKCQVKQRLFLFLQLHTVHVYRVILFDLSKSWFSSRFSLNLMSYRVSSQYFQTSPTVYALSALPLNSPNADNHTKCDKGHKSWKFIHIKSETVSNINTFAV